MLCKGLCHSPLIQHTTMHDSYVADTGGSEGIETPLQFKEWGNLIAIGLSLNTDTTSRDVLLLMFRAPL